MAWIPARYLIVSRFSFFSGTNYVETIIHITLQEHYKRILWTSWKTPSDVRRYTFLPVQICFVLNGTNTPGQMASSDVRRYTFLPGRICFVTENFLVLLCWREVTFCYYQIVLGLPPPGPPLILTLTLLSVGTWGTRLPQVLALKGITETWQISGRYSVAQEATCMGLA